MKNFTLKKKRNNLQFVASQMFFAFIVIVSVAFLPKPAGALSGTSSLSQNDIINFMASSTAAATITAQQNAASSTAAASAAEQALSSSTIATASAEEKRLTDEQILKQLEALRGVVPNSTLNALEKKYQVGAYAPKPASLAVSATSAQKTATVNKDASFVFLKNLKQGDTNTDVIMLQAILNRDSDTQIAKTGVGSSGNETTYFGAKTKAAVIKFQNKHAAEILVPNGLTSGTGFVGLSTRVVLNTLATGKNVPATSLVNIQTIVSPKAFFCQPTFTVEHGPELTASENASIGCVVANTQSTCEKVDVYTKSTNSFTGGDGVSDCRWVAR